MIFLEKVYLKSGFSVGTTHTYDHFYKVLRGFIMYVSAVFFQGLVVGSGIDWASDDEMRRLVLSLGETLQFAAT